MGNLEGTLTNRGSSKCGASAGSTCFSFRAPPSYAPTLRDAGFTVLNLANNHALDYGSIGQQDTVAAVRSAGLLTTGRPARSPTSRSGAPGSRSSGSRRTRGRRASRTSAGPRRSSARPTRAADLVVVTMHAGAEGSDRQHVQPGTEYFLGENRGNVYAFSHAVVDAGADLVVGHGPHVLRGMEWYRGRLIAYSMGNFLGYHTLSFAGVNGVTGILQVTLARNGTLRSRAARPRHDRQRGHPSTGPGRGRPWNRPHALEAGLREARDPGVARRRAAPPGIASGNRRRGLQPPRHDPGRRPPRAAARL